MARLTKLVLVFGVVLSSQVMVPAETQAGIIPWVYDAIFGPVGSMQSRAAYRGTVAAYPSYGYSSSYAPMSVAYAPATTAFYGSYASYSPAGGCSCNQQSYGYSAAPACSSCSSGNCSSGSGCSNCTVNSAPTTSGYGPTPDPTLNSSDSNLRLNELERQLKVLEHRQKEDEKFLGRQYEGKYSPDPYSPNNYGGRTETVPPRRQHDTFESNSPNSTFEQPIESRPSNRRRVPPADPLEEERRKPDLGAPGAVDEKSSENKSNEFIKSNEREPQTLRLENQLTSRAVAPKERMQIVTKQSKMAIANSNKKPVKTSDKTRSTDLARQ